MRRVRIILKISALKLRAFFLVLLPMCWCSSDARAFYFQVYDDNIALRSNGDEQIIMLAPGPTNGKDTTVANGSGADTNSGADQNLFLAAYAGAQGVIFTRRALVGFDLRSLPANSSIKAAFFSFYINGMSPGIELGGPPPGRLLEVRKLLQPDWTQNGATWNSYDGVHAWNTPGGDFAPTLLSSAPLTDFFNKPPSYPFYITTKKTLGGSFGFTNFTGDLFDITSEVTVQFATTKKTDLIVKYDNDRTNGGDNGLSLNSSESPNSGFRPALVIVYTVAVAPIPVISSIQAVPAVFSPASSPGVQDTTTIGYNISTDADVSIKISNSAGTIVRNVLTFGSRLAGSNSEIWDGKDDAGAFLPDGVYTFTIDAVGVGGSAALSGTVAIDNALPVISFAQFTVEYLANDLIAIHEGPGEQIIQIVPGPANGKDTTVANGSYADTNFGAAQSLTLDAYAGAQGVIFTRRALVGFDLRSLPANSSIEAAFFSFYIDGMSPGIELGGPPLGRSLEVRKLLQPDWTQNGATWNSYDGVHPWNTPGGDFAPTLLSSAPLTDFFNKPPSYPFYITTKKTLGGSFGFTNFTGDLFDITSEVTVQFATTKKTDLIVKYDNDRTNGGDNGLSFPSSEFSETYFRPQLTVVFRNNVFGPSISPGATTSIPYVLSQNANVTIKVLDSGGTVVRDLATSSPRTAGANTEIWDGKNDASQLVTDGVYTTTLDALDAAGNSAVQRSIKITIDNTTVAISTDSAVSLKSTVPGISINRVSTQSATVAFALATATVQGLQLVSPVYDIAPSTPFSPSAILTFKFDPSIVTDASDLAIFRYDGMSWSSITITSQLIFLAPDFQVTGTIAHSSLYALFVPDILAPRTALIIGQPQFGVMPTFISSSTLLYYNSIDDSRSIGDAQGSGVIQTLFSLDVEPFTTFLSSFTISTEGVHTIRFFSTDRVGNTEMVRMSSVAVDNTPPFARFMVNGATVPSGAVTAVEGSFFGFAAQDPVSNGVASGVSRTQFSLDSGPFTVFTSTFALSLGTHAVVFEGIDNVDNRSARETVVVTVIPPIVIALNLDPDTLNLKSQGQFVTAFIEVTGLKSAADIDAGSLKITNINDQPLATAISIVAEPAGKSGKLKFGTIGDHDLDGIPDLMVKFDRAALISVLPVGEQVRITVEGLFKDAQPLSTDDFIRTIQPGTVKAFDSGTLAFPGGKALVSFPAGSLQQDTDVTILKLTAMPVADKNRRSSAASVAKIQTAGQPFEFGPEGTQFLKPVTIVLPYDPAALPAGVKEDFVKIAYWNPMAQAWEILPSQVDKQGGVVTAQTTHFSQYQAVAPLTAEPEASVPAADQSFRLGEVYTFPNPARRSQRPTLHIEAGLADSVDIHIYDVSGQLVHKAGVNTPPALIDDGQGPQYAYEYTWDTSGTGSGVYVYVVNAHKNGQGSLKRIGKCAVIK